MERTFVAIKPDAVQRGLIGEIFLRFERKGLKLVALKFMKLSREQAENHYGEHKGKPFYEDLVGFITSGPLVAMVWEGKDAVAICRKIMGATKPQDAEPGTIRFDFAMTMERNAVHGSDSPASAEREIAIFFQPEEMVGTWDHDLDHWIYKPETLAPAACSV